MHIDIESRSTPDRDNLMVSAIGHDNAEVDRVFIRALQADSGEGWAKGRNFH